MAKSRNQPERRIGQLPPRYSFALNPYNDVRFSKCPNCGRATYSRKFPLFIYVHGFGAIVLGKTCRYCPKCEFIIAHQDELEHELVIVLSGRAPEVIGNDYFVSGTVEKKAWRAGFDKEGLAADVLPNMADFKQYMTPDVRARWVDARRLKRGITNKD